MELKCTEPTGKFLYSLVNQRNGRTRRDTTDTVFCNISYLLEQFLKKSVNKRTDQYGGSLENRLRFPLEVIDAVVAAVGDESKVGLRVSPYNVAKGIVEEAPLDTYVPFLQKVLEKHPRFAYIHAVESRIASSIDRDVYDKTETLDPLREVVTKHVRSRNEHEGQGDNGSGTKFIAAGGYTPEAALEASDRHGDLVAFGRYFISNPDLPERIKNVSCAFTLFR